MTSVKEIEKPKGHIRIQCGVAILASMTAFTYGLQCGWVSPMTKTLQSTESPVGRSLTNIEISLVAGLPSLTAMIAIFILAFFVDIYGRKKAIITMVSLQFMCWVIKLCPANPTSLFIARLFCGLGGGGCYHTIPMYIKEISQDNVRGALVAMIILGQNLGILIMYGLGAYLDYYTVLYVVVGLPIITIFLLLRAPESPAFLVKIGKIDDATATVAFLRGLQVNDREVVDAIDAIKKQDEYFNSIPNISFLNIFKDKAWRRGFVLMFIITTISALNGVFSIINYAEFLLTDSKTKISAKVQTLGIPVFLTIGTFITMIFVDKFGRRVLLGLAYGITALSFIGLASSMLLGRHGFSTPGWLLIVSILVAVCCYGSGVSPVPYIIISELFNFQVRSKLMACLCITSWGLSFVQLVSFTAIATTFGVHIAFFIFGAVNIIGTIIVIILLPETAHKTVEEIEQELRK